MFCSGFCGERCVELAHRPVPIQANHPQEYVKLINQSVPGKSHTKLASAITFSQGLFKIKHKLELHVCLTDKSNIFAQRTCEKCQLIYANGFRNGKLSS